MQRVTGTVGAGGSAGGSAGAGIGQGMGTALKGLAGGLSAIANPMALIGLGAITLAVMGLAKAFEIASPGFEGFGKMVKSVFEGFSSVFASFGVVITSIGTAISTVFNGLTVSISKLSSIDPLTLLGLSGAIGAMGAALGLFGITGGLAAISIGTLANGLTKMSEVDTARLLKVAEAMEKVNAATPSVGQTLRAGFAGIVNKAIGGSETTPRVSETASEQQNRPATADSRIASASERPADLNNLASELKKLNSVSADLLKNMKEVVEYARRNVDATKALSGNLFPTP